MCCVNDVCIDERNPCQGVCISREKSHLSLEALRISRSADSLGLLEDLIEFVEENVGILFAENERWTETDGDIATAARLDT